MYVMACYINMNWYIYRIQVYVLEYIIYNMGVGWNLFWFPCKLFLGPPDMEIIKKKTLLMGAIRGHYIRLHDIKVLGQDQFITEEKHPQELWTTSYSYISKC